MMFDVTKKLQCFYKKHKSEMQALVTGQMPSFVYGRKEFKDIPVFCFHSAQYPLFEQQLQFLNDNGYRTLSADELYERFIDKDYKNDGKEIVITFDDGMSSVWTVAYPLLKKYKHKIVSFILPSLIKEGEFAGQTIDDVGCEDEKKALTKRDRGKDSLCNWQEIKIMHESGVVDFQSHGMVHSLISTSLEIVDFVSPSFDENCYGNVHIPVYQNKAGKNTRAKVLGHPVYQSASRFTGEPRYFDPVELRTACAGYVVDNGGENFFHKCDWKRQLQQIALEYQKHIKENTFETRRQVERKIVNEVRASKLEIESKLNKSVRHFCFPWFVGSVVGLAALESEGYLSAYMGETNGSAQKPSAMKLQLTNRVQEEYLFALPGKGSHSLLQVLKTKIRS